MSEAVLQNVHNRKFAPGLRGLEFFKTLPNYRRDVLGELRRVTEKFGDTVCLRGLKTVYVVTHPTAVEHVLQSNSRNYRKGKSYEILKHSTGNGLFVSEGDVWLRQRRLAQPIFHHRRIAKFADMISDSTAEMLNRWERTSEAFDVLPEMMRLTVGIVGKSLFGADLGVEVKTFADAFEIVREYTVRRTLDIVKIPKNFPVPLNLRFRRALASVDSVIYRLIRERRESPQKFDDLLTMLMNARDEETGAAMDERQLRDEVVTLVGAGYETTATALAWTFYLLARHPEKEAKLRREIETILGKRAPTFDDLPRLEYARFVFQEAMRLYPPIWGLERTAIEADEIGGYYVPAKTDIIILQYLTHRHPDFWDEPEEFSPERFEPEIAARRPKFAYFPFGGGSRICIGNGFATMEAQIIIAMILQRFRIRLVSEQKVEPEASVTLRPRNGVRIVLERL